MSPAAPQRAELNVRALQRGWARLAFTSRVHTIRHGGKWAEYSGMRDDATTITELKRLVRSFVEERDWQSFHDPKNLSASIAIEAAELMEHFQWLRSDELEGVRVDAAHMQAIREEAADIAAYLLSFADRMGIDLAAALQEKMQKNAIKYPVDRFRGKFR